MCLWVDSVDPSNGKFTFVGSRIGGRMNPLENNPVKHGSFNWLGVNVISFVYYKQYKEFQLINKKKYNYLYCSLSLKGSKNICPSN